MRLFVTPRAGAVNDEVRVSGEVLVINGDPIDLSAVPEPPGYAEPGALPFLGRIQRVDGVLYVNIVVHYDAATRRHWPAPRHEDLAFDLTDGLLPAISAPDLTAEIEEAAA